MDAQPSSAALIEASLAWTQAQLGVVDRTVADWTGSLHQNANRLAHLCWLRDQGVEASLVHVLFTDDPRSPASEAEWHTALQAANEQLGLAEGAVPHAGHVLLPALDTPR